MANDVDRVIRDMNAFVAGVVRVISVSVTNNVTVSTPVDTGFAKSNWIPSVGKPKSSPSGSRTSVSSGAQKSGLGRLKSYRVTQGRVFIVNNVEYIGDLNSGSSSQAPAGFVQGGIARGVSAAVRLAPKVAIVRSR